MSYRALFSTTRLRKKFKNWLYNSCPGRAGWMSYFGERIYFPRNCHLVNRVVHSGIYEPELLADLQATLRSGGVHFDVGANIGLMAIPLLCQNLTIHVHSFEPSPRTFNYLEHTHRESRHRDRWTISDVALASGDGTTSFWMHPESEGAFDGIANTGRVGHGQEVQVRMMKMDTYWIEVGQPAVRSIKIDVEGFEDEVLKGAEQLLKTCRPLIFLEWSASNLRPGLHATELLRIASNFGYRIYSHPWRQSITDITDLDAAMRFTESFMMAPISSDVTNV